MRFENILTKTVTKDLLEDTLNEVNMSPSALAKFVRSPEAQGIRAGFEAELVFSGLGGEDEDDYEPDYDMDERATGISDIIDFFRGGDNGISSRQASNLESQLQDAYYEWSNEKMQSEFEDEAQDLVREYIEQNHWSWDEQIEEALDQMGLSDEELELAKEYIPLKSGQRTERSKTSPAEEKAYDNFKEAQSTADDELSARAEQSVDDRDSIYDEAWDDWMQGHSGYDEDDWLREAGLRYMSDVSNEYSIDWPYWTSSGSSDEYNHDNAENLARSLAKELGVKTKASWNYHSAARDEETWIFEPDSSINADDGDMPVEIISPPMPLGECLIKLEKFVEWALDNGAYSNSSTGFHVGVSLPFRGGDIDYVKLALFLGDEHILKTFGREANHFCSSAIKNIKGRVTPDKAAGVLELLTKNLAELAGKHLVKTSPGKYSSINMKDNYVEFRGAGNDYISNLETIMQLIERYAYAMHIAGSPELERKEYAKKLYKLVAPQGDESLKLFAMYAAGEIDKEKLKKAWAERTLEKEAPAITAKKSWSLYDRSTEKFVAGQHYSGYSYDDALERARQSVEPESSTEEFLSKYVLASDTDSNGLWDIVDRESEKVFKTIKADSRSQASAEAAKDTGDTGLENYFIRPHINFGSTPTMKLSRRAELARRIKSPPKVSGIKATIGSPQPIGKEPNYYILNRDTNAIVQKFYAQDNTEAVQYLQAWKQRNTGNFLYGRLDIGRGLRGNFEVYAENDPSRVLDRLTNVTAEEARQYIRNAEESGEVRPGVLRVRVVP